MHVMAGLMGPAGMVGAPVDIAAAGWYSRLASFQSYGIKSSQAAKHKLESKHLKSCPYLMSQGAD